MNSEASDFPLVAVLDYGIGNLRSAQKGLQRVGADARLTDDPGLIREAAGVVLPGVGAFGRCMEELRAHGLDEQAIALEMLTGIRRAGADLIITYWAKDVARWLA